MGSMSALAYCAQAVEGGNTQGRGKIAVRASAGGRLAQFQTQFFRHCLRHLQQPDRVWCALHGRTINAAADFQPALRVKWTQPAKPLLQFRRIGQAGHADVHFYPGLGRHHITARASLYYAGIDGDAALEVHKFYDLQDMAGKLHDGVLPFLKIHTTVRSLATNAQGEVAYALARRLELSLRPL